MIIIKTALLSILSVCPLLYAIDYLAVMDTLSETEKSHYHIIRRLDHHFLAILSDTEMDEFRSTGRTLTVVDTNPKKNLYFLVGRCREPLSTVSRYGTVLARFEHCFLIKTSETNIDSLLKFQLQLDRIFFDRLQYNGAPPRTDAFSRNVVSNKIITEILNSVSTDTLRAFVKKLQSFDTRHASSSANKSVVCPWLRTMLEGYCDSVYLDTYSSSYGPNVVGIKFGKIDPSPTKYCVIGGHLDGVSQGGQFKAAGADDNATGAAAVLECARVFGKYSFENTIRFVLFNAEEVGIVGSKGFTQKMKDGKHTLIGGAITFDMLGHSQETKNKVLLEGTGTVPGHDTFIKQYMQGIVDTYTKMSTDVSLSGYGSDHTSFWPHNYIAILLIEKDEKSNLAYHKPWDTLDCPTGLNDMALFTNIAKTGIAAIADLAKPKENSPIHPIIARKHIQPSVMVEKRSSQHVFITVAHDIPGNGRVQIFNSQGRALHYFDRPAFREDNKSVYLWNVHDNDGSRAKAGMFIVLYSDNGNEYAKKIILSSQ